jgi:asparagine N-glycosylation enzyme membrane subunit Stt3
VAVKRRRPRRLLAPVGLFLLALAVRALPWPGILTPDRVYFFGTDAYYHMRRVLYSLVHFPAVLEFDHYVNFPHGAMPIWPPLFDTTLALLLLPFHDPEHLLTIERIAVWVPPLLGAATVLALYFIAERLFGFATALFASLILAVLSAHFWYSQIGFVDHHAAVALVSTLLLGSALGMFQDLSDASARAREKLAPALVTGLVLAVLLDSIPAASDRASRPGLRTRPALRYHQQLAAVE